MRCTAVLAIAFVLAVTISTTSPEAFGQTRTNATGTGGIHEVRGKLYLPNGRNPDEAFEIELQSQTHPALKGFTDRNGGYSFPNLAPGNYSLVVKGGEYFDTAVEYFTIDTEVQTVVRVRPTPKIITLPIHLQLKKGAPKPKNEVINARWSEVPKPAIERYNAGIQRVKENKPDLAATEFEKAIELAPEFAPAYTALGKLRLLRGQLDEAEKPLRVAVRIDAGDFDARLNLGIVLLNKMMLDEAQRIFGEAADIDKSAVTPRYYIGRIHIQKKDLDLAQQELEIAKQMNGDKPFPLLHRFLGGIYAVKNLNRQAVIELETYLTQDPSAKDAERIRQTIADLKAKQE